MVDKKELFYRGVVGGRLSMLVGLLIIAVINADVAFFQKSPTVVFQECCIVGSAAIASSFLLGLNRKAKKRDIIRVALVAFLVFFTFHLLTEFCGGNRIQKPYLMQYFSLLICIWAIPMFILAIQIKDFSIHKHEQTSAQQIVCIAAEMIIFGIIHATPVFIIQNKRGYPYKHVINSTYGMALYYCLAHLLLQTGGFWSRTRV